MKLQKKHEVLEHLRAKDSDYKELLGNLFQIIDPERKNYKELIWLMAMPDSLRKESHTIVKASLSALEPEPDTLGDLVESFPRGTLFDAIGLGKSYTMEGPIFDAATSAILVGEYACKEIGSQNIVSLPYTTKIRWIF